jgi:hypothetical protein
MVNRSVDRPPSRGGRRMKELGAAAEVERAQLEADLIAGLGRTPSAIDRVGAEAIAAGVVRSRRLRAAGKSDLEERRTVIQAIRATGMRPGPATQPAPMSIAERLRAAGYAPPPDQPVAPPEDDEDDEAVIEDDDQ